MARRLILGWGASANILVEFEQRSAGQLAVVTKDGNLASTLREEGITVHHGDPGDTDTLQIFDGADAILVGDQRTHQNIRIAQTARDWFPHAKIIAYCGSGATPAERTQLGNSADHLVDHVSEVGDAILDVATSAAAVRAHRVRAILDSIDGKLCVFMHNNPDPDALASAVGIVRIAESRGVQAAPYYYGEITHQSNRAFVNVLDLPIQQLDPDDPFPECAAIGLVDHALPGVNDDLPPDLIPDLIFDHHTPSGPIEGRYVDLRESVGATSSMVVEYLRQLEITIGEDLATGLLNGIRTDTKNFSRKVSPIDFDAAGYLWNTVNHRALDRIENPSLSRDTLSTIGDAISERSVRGPALASCVGEISSRDALAQAADLLLQMDGIDILLVYGIEEDAVHASARARPTMQGIDLADIMREAYGPIGTAGGHQEMAGAQIPLGMLATTEEHDDALIDVVREVIDERFFETVEDRLHPVNAFSIRDIAGE